MTLKFRIKHLTLGSQALVAVEFTPEVNPANAPLQPIFGSFSHYNPFPFTGFAPIERKAKKIKCAAPPCDFIVSLGWFGESYQFGFVRMQLQSEFCKSLW